MKQRQLNNIEAANDPGTLMFLYNKDSLATFDCTITAVRIVEDRREDTKEPQIRYIMSHSYDCVI